jgi:hypothetical protein
MTTVNLNRRNLLAAGGSVFATGVFATGVSGLLLPARAEGLLPTDAPQDEGSVGLAISKTAGRCAHTVAQAGRGEVYSAALLSAAASRVVTTTLMASSTRSRA